MAARILLIDDDKRLADMVGRYLSQAGFRLVHCLDARSGHARHDPATLETNVPGVFVAGVVTAGYDANKVFIENGRFHGERIVGRLAGRPARETPGVSVDLDG